MLSGRRYLGAQLPEALAIIEALIAEVSAQIDITSAALENPNCPTAPVKSS